jgi:hypothetical protein
MGKFREQIETLGDGIDDAIGRSKIAALTGNVIPDVAEFGSRLRCEAIAPLFRGSNMLGGKLGPAAPFHVFGQRTHRGLSDFDAFAAVERGFGNIDGGKDFRTAALAFDPQCDCRLHRILGALKSTALDSAADKVLLFRRQIYLHALNLARLAHESRESMIPTR